MAGCSRPGKETGVCPNVHLAIKRSQPSSKSQPSTKNNNIHLQYDFYAQNNLKCKNTKLKIMMYILKVNRSKLKVRKSRTFSVSPTTFGHNHHNECVKSKLNHI